MIRSSIKAILAVIVAMTLTVMAAPQMSGLWSAVGSEWNIYTVDSAGKVGEYNSIALDSSGNPHISYYDITNYALKYATIGKVPVAEDLQE